MCLFVDQGLLCFLVRCCTFIQKVTNSVQRHHGWNVTGTTPGICSAFSYFIFTTILWDKHFDTHFPDKENSLEKFNDLLKVTHLGWQDWPENTLPPRSGANTLSYSLPITKRSSRYGMGFWKSTDFSDAPNLRYLAFPDPKSRTNIIKKPWAHTLKWNNRSHWRFFCWMSWLWLGLFSACFFFLWGDIFALKASVIFWDNFLVQLWACRGCRMCFPRFVGPHRIINTYCLRMSVWSENGPG